MNTKKSKTPKTRIKKNNRINKRNFEGFFWETQHFGIDIVSKKTFRFLIFMPSSHRCVLTSSSSDRLARYTMNKTTCVWLFRCAIAVEWNRRQREENFQAENLKRALCFFFGAVVEGSKAFCRAANITYLFSTFPIRRREAAQRLAFSDFSVCVKTSKKTDAKYRAEDTKVNKVSRGVVKTLHDYYNWKITSARHE